MRQCRFCGNDVDGAEDETVAGRPHYERNSEIAIPAAARPMEGEAPFNPDALTDGLGRLLRFLIH
jgi:hypothetical protein